MKEGKFSFSNKKQTSVMAAAAVLGLLIFFASGLDGTGGQTGNKANDSGYQRHLSGGDGRSDGGTF